MYRPSLFLRLTILVSCLLLISCQSNATTPQSEQQTHSPSNKENPTNQTENNKSTPPKKVTPPVKPDQTSPKGKANSQGVITKMEKEGAQKVKIYLDKQAVNTNFGSKGQITIDHETNIRYANLQTIAPVTIKDLKVGKKVLIWCTGIYPMIFPLQCKAGEVVLED